MSKKKNTLKDLDAFLKQQAATIVPPPKLSEKIDDIRAEGKGDRVHDALSQVVAQITEVSRVDRADFRHTLYDLILRSIESQPTQQPEDILLINTVLYLKNGDNWKEAIIEYWKRRYGSAS